MAKRPVRGVRGEEAERREGRCADTRGLREDEEKRKGLMGDKGSVGRGAGKEEEEGKQSDSASREQADA